MCRKGYFPCLCNDRFETGLNRHYREEMGEIRCIQCKRCLSVENFKVKTSGQLARMCIKCLNVKKSSRERTRCPHKRERQHCQVCDPVGYQYYRVLAMIRNALDYDTEIVLQDYLGCDIVTFMKHIQSQFGEGMHWGNRGEWEFDHKIPLRWRENGKDPSQEEQVKRLDYTNMQPLWSKYNIAKGNRCTCTG